MPRSNRQRKWTSRLLTIASANNARQVLPNTESSIVTNTRCVFPEVFADIGAGTGIFETHITVADETKRMGSSTPTEVTSPSLQNEDKDPIEYDRDSQEQIHFDSTDSRDMNSNPSSHFDTSDLEMNFDLMNYILFETLEEDGWQVVSVRESETDSST